MAQDATGGLYYPRDATAPLRAPGGEPGRLHELTTALGQRVRST